MKRIVAALLILLLALPAHGAAFKKITVRGITYWYYPDEYFEGLKVSYCPKVHPQMIGMCEWLLRNLRRNWDDLYSKIYYSHLTMSAERRRELEEEVAKTSERLLLESQNFIEENPHLLKPPPAHMSAPLERGDDAP